MVGRLLVTPVHSYHLFYIQGGLALEGTMNSFLDYHIIRIPPESLFSRIRIIRFSLSNWTPL